MHPVSTSRALGFDDDALARAREEGHVVGRGEGFTSREWRAGRPLVAIHTSAADEEVVCIVPFVAGFPWREWTLQSVRADASCPHCSTVVVRAGGLELVASIPDYAARRKMLPVTLAVQASVLVVVDEWRRGEPLPSLVTSIAESAAARLVVSGRIVSTTPLTNEATGRALVACEVENGGGSIVVVGPDGALAPGDEITATGRALARIGAPIHRRGA